MMKCAWMNRLPPRPTPQRPKLRGAANPEQVYYNIIVNLSFHFFDRECRYTDDLGWKILAEIRKFFELTVQNQISVFLEGDNSRAGGAIEETLSPFLEPRNIEKTIPC